MARTFANTAGSPNIDYITYSGVPPVAGLATCSIVFRASIASSGGVNFSGLIGMPSAGDANTVSVGRWELGKIYMTFRNGTASEVQQIPFAFDGVLRSCVLTYSGSSTPKTVGYVDGVSQTISGSTLTNTTIGSGQSSCVIANTIANRWNGVVAEMAIYNRVITQAEATMHAAGYSCRHFPRGLIFYTPLIREVHDIAGGLTGTITGTTVSDHPRIYA